MDKRIEDDSVTTWIGQLRNGNLEASKKLWKRYFNALADFARRKLPGHLKQMVDEEDIALSTFNALLNGLREGQFDAIRDRHDLWQTLTLIAGRKSQNHVKYETRQRRDGRRKQTDSALLRDPRKGPSPKKSQFDDPAWLAEFSETCQELFEALPNERLRQVAAMRLEGYGVREIAAHFSVSLRTIERKLSLIRIIWVDASEHGASDQSD